jgi:hypothetical protein
MSFTLLCKLPALLIIVVIPSIKLCCRIWISINDAFQVLTTHMHGFLFYIFLLLMLLLLFAWNCLQAPLFFHILCTTTSNFVKIKYLGFLCPFNLAFYSLSFLCEHCVFFLLCATSTLDFVKASNCEFFFLILWFCVSVFILAIRVFYSKCVYNAWKWNDYCWKCEWNGRNHLWS